LIEGMSEPTIIPAREVILAIVAIIEPFAVNWAAIIPISSEV